MQPSCAELGLQLTCSVHDFANIAIVISVDTNQAYKSTNFTCMSVNVCDSCNLDIECGLLVHR